MKNSFTQQLKSLIKDIQNFFVKQDYGDPNFQFGLINVENGDFQKGYISKEGKMEYKAAGKEEIWGAKQFHDMARFTRRWWQIPFFSEASSGEYQYETPIWCEKNKFTNKTRYFIESENKREYLNLNALSKGRVVLE